MTRPNFEDLKRRIAALEKESPAPSEAPWLEEMVEKATWGDSAEHLNNEELCGYADGVLRRKYPAIWQRVDGHVRGCLECQGEIKQLRSAFSLTRQVIEILGDSMKKLRDKVQRTPEPKPARIEPRPIFAAQQGEVAIYLAIARLTRVMFVERVIFITLLIAGTVFGGYGVKTVRSRTEDHEREVQMWRTKYAEAEARNEEYKKLFERPRANLPKEKTVSPPSSVPYTDPSVLPAFPEVPYTPSLKPKE